MSSQNRNKSISFFYRSPAKRGMAFVLMALFLALLAGCGAAPAGEIGQYDTAAVEAPAPSTAAAAPTATPEAAAAGEVAAENGDVAQPGGGPTLSLPQDNRKVVLTANLELEANDFDATCGKLQQSAEALGGYIAAADVRGDADAYTRFATFTVKIPAENYAEFLGTASEAGSMLSRSEQSEDVTDTYTDVEARLKSLRIQEQRLLELLQESGRLDDLFMIQNQLTQVQYEIESYVAQQRNLDGRISHSTVYISVDEVDQITPPRPDDTFWTQLGAAFVGTWENVLYFLQGLVIALVWLLPLLIVLAIALPFVLFALKKWRKKRAENPPARPAWPTAPYSAYPGYTTAPTAPAAMQDAAVPAGTSTAPPNETNTTPQTETDKPSE